jgi:hypothetical protein
LSSLREHWQKIVSQKSLPWYAEEKIRSGAFAALAGLILEEKDLGKGSGKWRAMALGDSCIFQLREARILERFPMKQSEDFNNSPLLLASKIIAGEPELRELPIVSGRWLSGDTFYLMTDAIACWFMRQIEFGKVPAQKLGNLTHAGGSSFQSWLNSLRETGNLRNDDVTILRVEIEKN